MRQIFQLFCINLKKIICFFKLLLYLCHTEIQQLNLYTLWNSTSLPKATNRTTSSSVHGYVSPKSRQMNASRNTMTLHAPTTALAVWLTPLIAWNMDSSFGLSLMDQLWDMRSGRHKPTQNKWNQGRETSPQYQKNMKYDFHYIRKAKNMDTINKILQKFFSRTDLKDVTYEVIEISSGSLKYQLDFNANWK